MPRLTLSLFVVIVAIFFAGFAVGLYSGESSSMSGKANSTLDFASGSADFSGNEAKSDLQARTALSARIRELDSQLAAERDKSKEAMLDRLAFFKKFGRSFNMQPFNSDLSVTPEMAALLGLTDSEKRQVEQDLRDAKGELTTIKKADTKVFNQTDHTVSYAIAADPQGDALKKSLQNTLSDDIGQDRADVFMGDGKNWSFASSFAGFLDQKQEINISWSAASGSTIYNMNVHSENGSYSTSGSELPFEYRDYLPASGKP